MDTTSKVEQTDGTRGTNTRRPIFRRIFGRMGQDLIGYVKKKNKLVKICGFSSIRKVGTW